MADISIHEVHAFICQFTCFLFRDITFHLAHAPFASLPPKMELFPPSHPPISNILLLQTSS